jgi:hypothetical protein
MNTLTRQKNLLRWARGRAELKGVAFQLTVEDVKIPEFCPVLGIPLRHGVGKPCDNSPTIDRIVPEVGYVPGNILIISYRANRIKNNASFWEMRMMVEFYEEHITKKWMK